MISLNDEPAIISMANALDLDLVRPADAIMEYCHTRVRRFLRGLARLRTIDALLTIICERLNLTVHEIHADEDIVRYAQEYLAAGEVAVAGLVSTQMKPDTFGMLVTLEALSPDRRLQFVTFIDCRGDKAARRVWTLWHEISHCLTTKDQLALPLRRTTTVEAIEKDPVERLTDQIAATFAFYEPLFMPLLEAEYRVTGRLSFDAIERVRARFNPDASFDSTLRACVTKIPTPVLLLEAGLVLKKNEQRLVDSGEADPTDFQADLRVLRSFVNEAGRLCLPHVPKQWKVPSESVITRVHANQSAASFDGNTADENMSIWTTSGGSRLPHCPVYVEARKIGQRVVALLACAA